MSGDLKYYAPIPPEEPFEKGDIVLVLDGQHEVLSEQVVVWVGKTRVRTKCGRRWSLDGWYIGENGTWPFPWIQKVSERS